MEKIGNVFSKLKIERLAVFAVLLIFVISMVGCVPSNNLPEIISLETGTKVLGPSESSFIECLAFDQDGDILTYNWTADDGNITSSGETDNNVAWTAPKREGIYSITVTVMDGKEGNDAVVSESITIQVKDNHEPVITEVVVAPEWVFLSESCQIELSAEDEDGDELSYEWVAEKGKISGTGQTAEWIAPDSPGLYEIKVIVSDGFGKETTRIISVSVSEFAPPVIKELLVTPEEPEHFKEKGDGYMILKDRTIEIECVLEGMNQNVTYEWSDGGDTYNGTNEGTSFSGQGATVKWTAPTKGGTVTVSVFVYDEIDNVVSKNLVFKVETCGCAF